MDDLDLIDELETVRSTLFGLIPAAEAGAIDAVGAIVHLVAERISVLIAEGLQSRVSLTVADLRT